MKESIYRLIEEKDQYFLEAEGNKKRMPASAEAVRRAALAGNLFLEGKKVVLDPFTKLKLVLTVKVHGEIYSIESHLRGPTQTLPLDRCHAVFAGTPPCVLVGHLLQSLSQDIDPRFLSLSFKGSKSELLDLLEEIEEEGEDAPEIILPSDVAAEPEETRPVLKLKDRSGAFADLWTSYARHGDVAIHDPDTYPWRKKEEEKSWEKDLLETDFKAKVVDSSHYYCPMDKVVQSLTFLLEIGWKIVDHKGREVVRQGEASVEVGAKEAAFLFKGHVEYGQHRADVKDIVGAFNRRERFVELSPLQVGLLDGERNPLAGLEEGVPDEEGILLSKSKIGLGLELLKNPAFRPREEIGSLMRKLSGRDLSIQPVLPSEAFQGTLHPYQQEGVNWLHALSENGLGALLADEMGLGKTVQVIAWLSKIEGRVLVVAPTSLLFHWRKECEKFLPSLDVYLHTGPDRVRTSEEMLGKKVILTSYALLRLDSALLSDVSFAAAIFDEAQAMKNPFSQTAEAASLLQASFRLAITGTPLENRHQDLWSIFNFLLPGLLGDRSAFQAKIQAGQADARYLHRMRQLVRPFILRRRKDLVADQLPEKIEQVIWVEMEEGQRTVYEEKLRAYKQGFVKKMDDSLTVRRMEVLEAILRLRQICCHPQLVDPALAQPSAKLDKLMEDVEAIVAEGRKALIYSQFTSMLSLIEREVKERGWGYVVLDGTTRDRETIVQKFQEDAATPLFLISLKAGGVGLNLTSADYVLLYDPWWNDAVERQAIDRAHRLGRQGRVVARRYATAFSIEEKIMRLKEHKAVLIEQLLEGEVSANNWNLEDLLELLEPT